MYFPMLLTALRRLIRRLAYELFQLALWVAFALRTLGSLRSAFGGGGANAAGRLGTHPATKPRRRPRLQRARLTYPSAA